uniref:Uncharacterized protein n=1 Tax=Anguilla anguilla TaxID=7936 RepID=A0A0E9PRZ8_ANGAN
MQQFVSYERLKFKMPCSFVCYLGLTVDVGLCVLYWNLLSFHSFVLF